MAIHKLAGQAAPAESLIDVDALIHAYHDLTPDMENPTHLVSFGTSGHRGNALLYNFNSVHILAITQAICDYRKVQGINGPLFLGKDTHALSAPAQCDAIEVFAANGVETIIQSSDDYTPTPVISHAILSYNHEHDQQADGVVITPSHNPPTDGGFKYNPPHGGPADTDVTNWIEQRANQLLREKNTSVKRTPYKQAINAANIHQQDFARSYIDDLDSVVDMQAIGKDLKIGVDPLGGAAVAYWSRIAEHYRLNLTVVNPKVDPTFSFMTLDHDGKIRMDCSSPYAMANLVKLKDQFSIAWGNDADVDRHGIVTPSVGLMNPNHYLAVAINYLLTHRPAWPTTAVVGKTLVSSALIDYVVNALGRTVYEVPVGFKWFSPGLFDGSICFGGEESAGASFLRRDGHVWTTDKDGIILGLLAAEITAVTGKDPGEHYKALTDKFGKPCYTRIDAPASPQQKQAFRKLVPETISATTLAGDNITAKLTRAPGNNADIGGLKVVTEGGWFAARPSGTENVYKLYAESFKDSTHLDAIVQQAQDILSHALHTE